MLIGDASALAAPALPAPSTVPSAIHFALVGAWKLAAENATLARDGGAVNLAFQSGKASVVASSERPVTVVVDGRPQPSVTAQETRLHTLFDSGNYGKRVMTLPIPKTGFEAFTFGQAFANSEPLGL